MVSLRKSYATHAARHAACQHPDFTPHGWPTYCDQCADPVTEWFWPSLTSDVVIRVVPRHPDAFHPHRALQLASA